MLTIPGYQVQEKLYESSRSRVYRGRRAGDEQTVILKVLNKAYPSPEELARFKLEYEIVKNLTLDGVVRAYSLKQYKNSLLAPGMPSRLLSQQRRRRQRAVAVHRHEARPA